MFLFSIKLVYFNEFIVKYLYRLTLLKHGISDLTPQEMSTKLFQESEGERRKQILNWITEIK